MLGLPIQRVSAVKSSSLDSDSLYVAKGVAATWKSHQLAMSVFLKSSHDYALILEDDFLLTKLWNEDALQTALSTNPDFFQLGFLITGPIDRIDFFLHNILNHYLKFLLKLSQISKFVREQYGSRLLVKEQAKLKWYVVPNDIRAGGQAYLVSRKFAQAAQEMNTPAFTSADGMFMTLGDLRTFRMFRFRKSIVAQTNSKSSVQQRFV